MKFQLPTELSSIIKVIGVGGGGSNAVNHMHAQGIPGVDFIICNTDKQALDMSSIPVKLQIGAAHTEGLGAGAKPERGALAAQENIEDIRQLLSSRTKMIFITAGMGGGTGTGAAPVIARVARDMNILTVGIVTMPFEWEGQRRKRQATAGVEELRQAVDTLLVINNDRLRDLYGNLEVDEAFAHADNVLSTAARGIADIIYTTGKVNVDFEDVRTVMSDSGVAIMGMAEAEGENRAIRAAQEALNSPMLNDGDIRGAKFVLLNLALGDKKMQMDEMTEITDHIQEAAGSDADVIWGYSTDESLGNKLRVTVIATGFNRNPLDPPPTTERKVTPLGDLAPTLITAPITSPLVGATKAEPEPLAEKPDDGYVVRTIDPLPVPSTTNRDTNEAESKPVPAPEVKQEQARIVFDAEPPKKEEKPAAAPAEQQKATPVDQPAKVVYSLDDDEPATVAQNTPQVPGRKEMDPVDPGSVTPPMDPRNGSSDVQRRSEERLARIREMTQRMRHPNGLSEYEKEPAFKRKNPAFTEVQHSSESNVSRYSLSEETDENGDRSVQLRKNNPAIHDLPD